MNTKSLYSPPISTFKKIGGMAFFVFLLTFAWMAYPSSDEQILLDSELSIKFLSPPQFPASLKAEGVVDGSAEVIVSVDRSGKLIDWIVTEATHRHFARSVEESIEEWIFEAPMKEGVVYATMVPVQLQFRIDGTMVINPNMLSVIKSEFKLGLVNESDSLAEYSIKELDRIPEPISIERPIVPLELLMDGVKEAVFEFYIDPEGKVHLPILRDRDEEIDDRVLIITQETIRKWVFSPPMVNGNPVVVKVAQKLVFGKE